MDLTYDCLKIPDNDLRNIRMAIFHSSGPGYYIIRNYLQPSQVKHLQTVWSQFKDSSARKYFVDYRGRDSIYFGCPNSYSPDDRGNELFHNWSWNPPYDDLTFSASMMVQMIRSQVMGLAPFAETMPWVGGRALCYRVMFTRNIDTHIGWHRDWYQADPVAQLDKTRHDLSRVQATLFLSRHGDDYGGEGFCFTDNAGRNLVMGRDVSLEPGDLVLWRYNNPHGVLNIQSEPGQIGFMRIIYPPEIVLPPRTAQTQESRP
ncbi:hypothetical protein [Azospirillum sp. sgz302134]